MPHIIIDNSFRIQGTTALKEVTETVTRTVVVATETVDDYVRLTPIALQLLAEKPGSVAVIGLGFGVLPRLLCRHHAVTAFEIEPGMEQHFLSAFAWASVTVVSGDYSETLRDTFDWIVYDLGGEVPEWLSLHGKVIVP